MDIEQFREEFDNKIDIYNQLGKNIVDSLQILLNKSKIKFLSIYYRVKETESFLEKIERKSYKNPFEDIEDICGIRIICYYQKDISLITEIIKKEFKIFESQQKESQLDFNEFGYRSHHIIASINPEWGKVPNYRELEGLKCEIQIRTVLMHAWAEIEHNLAYKSKADTPEIFRRKLHRISAKLEEADEQFEELKEESEKYQKKLVEKVKSTKLDSDSKIDLNLDSLQVFMDTNFPRRNKSIEATRRLVQELKEYDITLEELNESWKLFKPKLKRIEEDSFRDKSRYNKWVQVGLARIALDLTNDNFFNRHKKRGREKTLKEREELRKKYFA